MSKALVVGAMGRMGQGVRAAISKGAASPGAPGAAARRIGQLSKRADHTILALVAFAGIQPTNA